MIGSDAERAAQLVVELTVPDLDLSLSFYTRLGFALDRRDGAFAVLSWNGERLLFLDGDPRLVPMAEMYANVRVIVSDVDAVWREFRDLDVEVVEPIADRPWGLREFTLRDPAGFGVRFATPIGS